MSLELETGPSIEAKPESKTTLAKNDEQSLFSRVMNTDKEINNCSDKSKINDSVNFQYIDASTIRQVNPAPIIVAEVGQVLIVTFPAQNRGVGVGASAEQLDKQTQALFSQVKDAQPDKSTNSVVGAFRVERPGTGELLLSYRVLTYPPQNSIFKLQVMVKP